MSARASPARSTNRHCRIPTQRTEPLGAERAGPDREIPGLRDVTSDQQIAGTTATLRSIATRPRASAFSRSRSMTRCTCVRATASGAVFHPGQFLLGRDGMPLDLQGETNTLRSLYVRAASGNTVPLSALVRVSTDPIMPLAVNHQSQFPSVTISFNLRPGTSLGDVVNRITARATHSACRRACSGAFQGNAAAFQNRWRRSRI